MFADSASCAPPGADKAAPTTVPRAGPRPSGAPRPRNAAAHAKHETATEKGTPCSPGCSGPPARGLELPNTPKTPAINRGALLAPAADPHAAWSRALQPPSNPPSLNPTRPPQVR